MRVTGKIKGFIIRKRNKIFFMFRNGKKVIKKLRRSLRQRTFDLSKKLMLAIDSWDMVSVFIVMIIWIFMCAWLYYCISVSNKGCIKSGEVVVSDFWNYIYFSIISFTTVGFGDICPVGYCKVVVAVEGMSNFVFMGIFIGKLTGYKNTYMLERLYSSESDKRISGFSEGIRNGCNNIIEMSENRKFDRVQLETMLNVVIAIRRYLGYETYFGGLYGDISRKCIKKICKPILDFCNDMFKYMGKDIYDGLNDKENILLYKILQTEYIIADIIERFDSIDESRESIWCSNIKKFILRFSKEELGKELKINRKVVN